MVSIGISKGEQCSESLVITRCLELSRVVICCLHFGFVFVRIAIFGIEVLREERIVVVAEQRPDCTEDEVP